MKREIGDKIILQRRVAGGMDAKMMSKIRGMLKIKGRGIADKDRSERIGKGRREKE